MFLTQNLTASPSRLCSRLTISLLCVLVLVTSATTAFAQITPTKESLSQLYSGKAYSPYAHRSFPDRVFWGDTHLHTGLSMDAGLFGARLGLDDAYRFARGEEVMASSGQSVRLGRALDWLVIADHSDGMGFFNDLVAGDPGILKFEQAKRWYKGLQQGGEASVAAALDLYEYLENYEAKTGGSALALAHNGNLSNGIMFPVDKQYTGRKLDANYVEKRARWEPMYEISQIKGDGEAHPFLSPDDAFADYETWDAGNLDLSEAKTDDMLQYEYAREALKNGLLLEKRLGTNPYKFGLVGSTDSHTALAAVEEENFFGKATNAEPSPKRMMHPFTRTENGIFEGYELVASGYIGASELGTIWTDPDFDAKESAFYYARVLEIPTPRWVVYDAFRFRTELPEGAETTHQERAYTAPIWYTP